MRINLTEAIKRYILNLNWTKIRNITATTMSNISVIGFGLGIFEGRKGALTAGIIIFISAAILAGGIKNG